MSQIFLVSRRIFSEKDSGTSHTHASWAQNALTLPVALLEYRNHRWFNHTVNFFTHESLVHIRIKWILHNAEFSEPQLMQSVFEFLTHCFESTVKFVVFTSKFNIV